MREPRLELLLLREVAYQARRDRRRRCHDDGARRDGHRETRSVTTRTEDLPASVARRIVSRLAGGLEVRLRVRAQLLRQQYLRGPTHDLRRRPTEDGFRR